MTPATGAGTGAAHDATDFRVGTGATIVRTMIDGEMAAAVTAGGIAGLTTTVGGMATTGEIAGPRIDDELFESGITTVAIAEIDFGIVGVNKCPISGTSRVAQWRVLSNFWFLDTL